LICINAHQLLGQAHLFDDVSLNGQRHLPHL
jgi:hypothetical protein